MAVEDLRNALLLNVPNLAKSQSAQYRSKPIIYAYSDTSVLCPSCQVLAIWTETDTPNVQVATFARVLIRQHAKTGQRLV